MIQFFRVLHAFWCLVDLVTVECQEWYWLQNMLERTKFHILAFAWGCRFLWLKFPDMYVLFVPSVSLLSSSLLLPSYFCKLLLGSGFGKSKQWRVWSWNTTSCCNIHARGIWLVKHGYYVLKQTKTWVYHIIKMYAGFKNTHGKYNEIGVTENILPESWVYYLKAVWHKPSLFWIYS